MYFRLLFSVAIIFSITKEDPNHGQKQIAFHPNRRRAVIAGLLWANDCKQFQSRKLKHGSEFHRRKFIIHGIKFFGYFKQFFQFEQFQQFFLRLVVFFLDFIETCQSYDPEIRPQFRREKLWRFRLLWR